MKIISIDNYDRETLNMQYKNGKGPTRWQFLRGLIRALRDK